MALNSLYIRVTNTTAGVIFLADINQGFSQESAARVRRPGPVYVPANDSVELALSGSVLLSYENGDIAQQVTQGNLTVSEMGGGIAIQTWTYDFDVDGGAVSAITLNNLQADAKLIPVSLMIRGWVEVVTAPTSAGAARLTLGTAVDDNGFVTTVDPTAWSDGDIVSFAGALVTNGTEAVAPISVKNATAVALIATISAAALTAGKFNVHIETLAVFA